jgi:hypothetical protein
VTILERTQGTVLHDCLKHEGLRQFWGMPRENWDNWRLTHLERQLSAAMVDATNKGGNRFEVTTRNVRRFSIWVHEEMIDFSQPVAVAVNGRLLFNQLVQPSLSAALRSYERRRDWGLIYTAEIELTLPAR